jgi:hypothetical protein
VPTANAATASNDSFHLDIEQFDAPQEEQLPTPTPTPKPKSEQGGILGIAFIPSTFSFSMTESFIDFGVLSATNPVTRDTTIQVSSPGGGYQVLAYSDHVLLSKKNSSIPDTTCDNGSCSEVTPSLWENNLTYGFGFRCDSPIKNLCPSGFEAEKAYKQFSDKGKQEIFQPLIESANKGINQQARITYRVNISGAQQKEAYTNNITYIAVPNF